MKNIIIIIYSFTIFPNLVLANDSENIPMYSVMASSEEMSALEMNCEGKKPFNKISCEFIQKSIRNNSEDIKNIDSINNLKPNEFEKAFNNIIKSCDELKNQNKVSPKSDSLKQAIDQQNSIFKQICDCQHKENKKECLINGLNKLSDMKSKTCKLVVNKFTIEFKKISEGKWMNSPRPQGICNVVNATTLEFFDKFKWRFIQTRISSDKGNLCLFDINKPITYETGESIHKLNCDYIDLSSVL